MNNDGSVLDLFAEGGNASEFETIVDDLLVDLVGDNKKFCEMAISAIFSKSFFVYALPVGLDGLFRTNALVFGVMAFFSSSGVTLNSFSSFVSMMTGVASANATMGG